MGKEHLSAIGKTDSWITPKYITEALGHFDLDPCACYPMPWYHADLNFYEHMDGLSQEWKGRVWLNPPFNQYVIGEWFKKMSEHKNGLLLCSFAGETKRFKQYVWGKESGILIMDKRPYFHLPDGSRAKANSGQTMCIIAYDKPNLEILKNSGLGIIIKSI